MKPDTELDYRRRIARVIAEIVMNPAADHTVESLAAIAHFSPFHFHRIYRAITGESLAATVRRLRLAQASFRLTDASSSVILTALEAGYESPQSFARAFREFTGLNPTRFQAQQTAVGALPHVTMTSWPATTVFGLWHDGPIELIPHSFRRLRNWAGGRGYPWHEITRIGASFGDPEQATGYRYLAGIAPAEQELRTDGLEPCEISAGRYATYRLAGPYSLIASTLQVLFGDWLPQSGLELDDRPVLELYRNHPGMVADHTELITDLLIPIAGSSH